MTKSDLYYIVGKCLVLDENPEFKKIFVKLCESDSIDWLLFISICNDNLILPLLYIKFRSQGILEYLPTEVNEHLKEIYKINTIRNKEILRQIKSITAILNKKNITPLYMKGTGNLLDNLYSDVGERLIGDIDFLVSDEDFLKAVVLMLDAGYLSLMDTTPVDIRNTQHYPRMYHPNFIADIEIHRIPNETRCENWFNINLINAEKKSANTSSEYYIESDKHKIIHNFIHDQLDHQGALYGKVPLRDMYDIYLFSKRYSLIDTIPFIKSKRKAIAYFAFAQNLFGFNNQFFSKQNLSYWILAKRHKLNLDSNLFYKLNQSLVLSFIHLGNGYLGIFIKAIYSKEMRQKIINKLRNHWFYTYFFKKDKG